METPDPLEQKERIVILDIVRGIALCGILILNIPLFANTLTGAFNLNLNNETSFANIASWYITIMVSGSFRGLFSLLFGAGMILLIDRLENTMGIGAAEIYYKRLIWLLIFGLVNAWVLLWPGDILYSYAICGLFIFPLRSSSIRLLIGLSVFFLLVTMYKDIQSERKQLTMREKGLAALAVQELKVDSLSSEQKSELEAWTGYLDRNKIENLRKEAEKEKEKMRGSYTTVWEQLKGLNREIQTTMFYDDYFFDVMIFVLLGMAFYKLGLLTAERPMSWYLLFIAFGYIAGFGIRYLVGNSWRIANFDYLTYLDTRLIPIRINQITRILITLGNLGLIISMWKSGVFSWLLRPFEAVGQMAFTNYLMQSVICTLIFYGYGFGYYGHLQRYELWYVVLAVWIVQIAYSNLWLLYYKFGPLEWLWRSLTYWKLQPIRKSTTKLVVE